MFFLTFFNNKSKSCGQNYACYFHVKHTKLLFLAVLTWFLIIGKIQDGGQDGDHCDRPPAAPPSIKHTSSCYTTATYQKLREGVPSTPPMLHHPGGMNLHVCPKVKLWRQRSFWKTLRYREENSHCSDRCTKRNECDEFEKENRYRIIAKTSPSMYKPL